MTLSRIEKYFATRSFVYLVGGVLALGCGDDGGTSESMEGDSGMPTASSEPTSTTTPSSTPDSGQPPREGPEGCYIVDNHLCDCSLDEAACEAAEGVWTDGCTSCATTGDAGSDASPSPSASSETDAASASVAGCYDPEVHSCECGGLEAACTSSGGIWTEECSCTPTTDASVSDAAVPEPDAGPDAAPNSDAGDAQTPAPSSDAGSPDAASSDAGDAALSGFGCYDPAEHVCVCSGSESQCTTAGGIWTDACECP